MEPVFEPFVLLASRLILIPTPIAISFPTYRALYAALHADAAFCEMGFGVHFPARQWTDDEAREVIQTRDIESAWNKRGLGDFAVGFRQVPESYAFGTEYDFSGNCVVVAKGDDFQRIAGPNYECFENIKWAGYAGVRDATMTSLPPPEEEDPPFPPWYEMVELRYGISPEFWGKGVAGEAAGVVLKWSSTEKRVRRFIAETEKGNERSARLLQKLGFVPNRYNHWNEPSEDEWELLNYGNNPAGL
ncbi:GNAT family N-acetyltransferase [Aspergillus undulatus]|uniref:GNAT family N-acetyltransferase n=1 Tax=Aspergillus undulatus TaxID=1810928 RepID=UPI003CCDD18D